MANDQNVNLLDELEEATKPVDEFKPETEIDQEIDSDDFEETVDDVPETAQDDPVISAGGFKRMAKRWIQTFNVFQKTLLKPSYQRTILEKGDIEKMRSYRKDAELSKCDITDIYHENEESYHVIERFDKYMKAVEDLPLTQEEIDDLTEPLSEVIQKYNSMQVGPEGQLLLAVLVIMLPRVEPVFPSIAKLFNRG